MSESNQRVKYTIEINAAEAERQLSQILEKDRTGRTGKAQNDPSPQAQTNSNKPAAIDLGPIEKLAPHLRAIIESQVGAGFSSGKGTTGKPATDDGLCDCFKDAIRGVIDQLVTLTDVVHDGITAIVRNTKTPPPPPPPPPGMTSPSGGFSDEGGSGGGMFGGGFGGVGTANLAMAGLSFANNPGDAGNAMGFAVGGKGGAAIQLLSQAAQSVMSLADSLKNYNGTLFVTMTKFEFFIEGLKYKLAEVLSADLTKFVEAMQTLIVSLLPTLVALLQLLIPALTIVVAIFTVLSKVLELFWVALVKATEWVQNKMAGPINYVAQKWVYEGAVAEPGNFQWIRDFKKHEDESYGNAWQHFQKGNTGSMFGSLMDATAGATTGSKPGSWAEAWGNPGDAGETAIGKMYQKEAIANRGNNASDISFNSTKQTIESGLTAQITDFGDLLLEQITKLGKEVDALISKTKGKDATPGESADDLMKKGWELMNALFKAADKWAHNMKGHGPQVDMTKLRRDTVPDLDDFAFGRSLQGKKNPADKGRAVASAMADSWGSLHKAIDKIATDTTSAMQHTWGSLRRSVSRAVEQFSPEVIKAWDKMKGAFGVKDAGGSAQMADGRKYSMGKDTLDVLFNDAAKSATTGWAKYVKNELPWLDDTKKFMRWMGKQNAPTFNIKDKASTPSVDKNTVPSISGTQGVPKSFVEASGKDKDGKNRGIPRVSNAAAHFHMADIIKIEAADEDRLHQEFLMLKNTVDRAVQSAKDDRWANMALGTARLQSGLGI